MCLGNLITENKLAHFYFQCKAEPWWFNSLRDLDPGSGMWIPTEKGYVILEYMNTLGEFIIGTAIVLSAATLITVMSDGKVRASWAVWWVFPLIFYPLLLSYYVYKWSVFRPWTCPIWNKEPCTVYVHNPYPTPGEEEMIGVSIQEFRANNVSYLERASRAMRMYAWRLDAGDWSS